MNRNLKKWAAALLAVMLLAAAVGAPAEESVLNTRQQGQTESEAAGVRANGTKNSGRKGGNKTGEEENGGADAVSGATENKESKTDGAGGRQADGSRPQDGQKPGSPQKGLKSRGGRHPSGRGRASRKDSAAQEDAETAAVLPDLDALVEKGVISRETADRILAFAAAQPAPPAAEELLMALLDAGIITGAECEAMQTFLTAAAV